MAPIINLTAVGGINVETETPVLSATTTGDAANIVITNTAAGGATFSGNTAGDDSDIDFVNTSTGVTSQLDGTVDAGAATIDITAGTGADFTVGDEIVINGDTDHRRTIDVIAGDTLTLDQPVANDALDNAEVSRIDTLTVADTLALGGDVNITDNGAIAISGIGASDSGLVNGLRDDAQSVTVTSTGPGDVTVAAGTDIDGDPTNGRDTAITADSDVVIINQDGSIILDSESIYAGNSVAINSTNGSILDITASNVTNIFSGNTTTVPSESP